MSDEAQLHWTAWWAIDGLGWVTFQRLLRLQKDWAISWSELWQVSRNTPERLGLSEIQGQAIKGFCQKFTPTSYQTFLAEKEIGVVSRESPTYPPLLKQIADPAPILFYKGNLELCGQPMIAVVGTRHVTKYGELVTRKISGELVDDGWLIVSGFMYGVDVIAHQTADQAGGRTVGVLGFGFDHLFPRSQISLLDQLIAGGHCFMTEYAPHVPGKAGLFPRRNRLIAGMAQGVIVTEAADQSGSLITAEYAAEYGRSIYAVPGPITNPFSNGTRALLNLGALCINSGHQVTEDQQFQGQSLPQGNQLSGIAEQVLLLLKEKKQTTAELHLQLELDMSRLLTELTQLELGGKISRVGESWMASE